MSYSPMCVWPSSPTMPARSIQQLPVIFCLDRAGMVGEDGQTHMGLYDIAYLLAVPNFTVTAPRDGAELIGLLRCALAHTDGPFSMRYPRDKAPGEAPPAAEVAPVPYGTLEVLRRGLLLHMFDTRGVAAQERD